jgi:protein phosphatase
MVRIETSKDHAMTTFTIRAAGHTSQGLRPSNEDRYAIDADRQVFVVVDAIGGGGAGERAADLTSEMLPARIGAALDDHRQPEAVIQEVFTETNQAVFDLSGQLGAGRRCGAAVVLAFRRGDQVLVSWLGDCRAYHVSGKETQQLTTDHTVRHALIQAGALTEEQAARRPTRPFLYRFLGCFESTEAFELRPIRPQPGDRLVLATDGLWVYVENDLAAMCRAYPDPQECAAHLVEEALRRGSRDNTTCIVAAFDPLCVDAAWLSWNGGLVVTLVQKIHEERDFGLMPILADALADAGCTNASILDHWRRPGPHHRGCWVVQALLAGSIAR